MAYDYTKTLASNVQRLSAGQDVQRNNLNTTRMEVVENANNLILAEQNVTELDLANIMAEQTITDLDLRVMELEAK